MVQELMHPSASLVRGAPAHPELPTTAGRETCPDSCQPCWARRGVLLNVAGKQFLRALSRQLTLQEADAQHACCFYYLWSHG